MCNSKNENNGSKNASKIVFRDRKSPKIEISTHSIYLICFVRSTPHEITENVDENVDETSTRKCGRDHHTKMWTRPAHENVNETSTRNYTQ